MKKLYLKKFRKEIQLEENKHLKKNLDFFKAFDNSKDCEIIYVDDLNDENSYYDLLVVKIETKFGTMLNAVPIPLFEKLTGTSNDKSYYKNKYKNINTVDFLHYKQKAKCTIDANMMLNDSDWKDYLMPLKTGDKNCEVVYSENDTIKIIKYDHDNEYFFMETIRKNISDEIDKKILDKNDLVYLLKNL